MFCPKCGIENPDNGKFCRSCRANLSNVLAAVEGFVSQESSLGIENNLAEIYSAGSIGIRNTILGAGFLVIGIFLKQMPPNDSFLWLLMMIPAFCLIASGVARLVKVEAMKAEKEKLAKTVAPNELPANQTNTALPQSNTEYISPVSNFSTNNLDIPIVTEETTKKLKVKQKKG